MKTFASTTHDANSINGLGVFTLVLWVGCALIGGLGFAFHYTRPHPSQAPPPPIKVEMLEVKLADEPQPISEPSRTFAATDSSAQPQIPQAIAVAQPSPAIAFALPVEGPVQIVEARHAAYLRPSTSAPATGPTPQALSAGESQQWIPKPDYPARARREGQQGVVIVRLTVAEDGHVSAVEAKEPSRWFLLNESALRAAKGGRFPPGNLRIYDVPIRFELK